MADVKALEEKFRSLPRGTVASNKAFKEWRDTVNSQPPEETTETKSVSEAGRRRRRAK